MKTVISRVCWSVVVLAGFLSVGSLRSGAASPSEAGLAIGDKAPEFVLNDAAGKAVSLGSMLARGKVVIVFFRSAGWCPYCQKHLVHLQENLEAIREAGGQLVAISYDDADVLKRFAEKRGITYPLLSDPGSKTIEAYGVLNTEATGRSKGIPHPGTFVLDSKGTIRARFFEESYRERHSAADLVVALKQLP